MFPVHGNPVRLINRTFIPVQAQPGHAFQDGVNGFFGGTDLIRVFDPEDELSAPVTGEKPIKKSCPGPPDMQEAGRAGGKTQDYWAHDLFSLPFFNFILSLRILAVKREKYGVIGLAALKIVTPGVGIIPKHSPYFYSFFY